MRHAVATRVTAFVMFLNSLRAAIVHCKITRTIKPEYGMQHVVLIGVGRTKTCAPHTFDAAVNPLAVHVCEPQPLWTLCFYIGCSVDGLIR